MFGHQQSAGGANKQICSYYLKGTCKYGAKCWNYHPPSQGQSSGVFGGTSNVFGGKPAASQESKEFTDFVKQVSGEMTQWERSGQWLPSSFSPLKSHPPLVGFSDTSPEEFRVEGYEAIKNNTYAAYQAHWAEVQQRFKQLREALKMSTTEAVQALRDVFYNKSPLEQQQQQVLKQPAAGLFGKPAASVFGGGAVGTSSGGGGAAGAGLLGAKPGAFGNTAPSIFGSGAQTAATPGLFGGAGTGASKSLFGAQTSVFGASGSSVFGAQPSGSTSLFGASATPGTSLFGSGAARPGTTGAGQSSGSVFGAAGTQQATGSLFGSQPQQGQPPQTSLFGGQAQTQPPQSASLFGGQTQQAGQQGSGGSLFGAQQPQPTQQGGLFGGQTQQAGQTAGIFGGQAQTSQQGGLFGGQQSQPQQTQQGLFGGTAGQQGQQTGIFGAQPQGSTFPIGGVFGGQTTGATQQSSIFGASAFPGASQGSKPGLFGATAATGTAPFKPGLFGAGSGGENPPSGTPAPTATPGLFGNPAQPTPGLFGHASQAPQAPQSTQSSAGHNYTPLDQLQAEDRAQFEADMFNYIPRCPPPIELCS